MKDCVFIHVPRTGGSSLWHSLVPLAQQTPDRAICDIYHECKQTYGSPKNAALMVQTMRERLGEKPTLFHHHTSEPIPALLDSPDVVLATVLRDPVDRFVSAAFNRRKFLLSCTDPAMIDFHVKAWGEEFVRVAMREDASRREVLDAAASDNSFYDFYTRYFGRMFRIPTPPAGVFSFIKRTPHARRLAKLLAERFDVIGDFNDLSATHDQIASAFDIPCADGSFSLEINRAAVQQPLSSADRMRYQRLFKADYALLYELHAMSAIGSSKNAKPMTLKLRRAA